MTKLNKLRNGIFHLKRDQFKNFASNGRFFADKVSPLRRNPGMMGQSLRAPFSGDSCNIFVSTFPFVVGNIYVHKTCLYKEGENIVILFGLPRKFFVYIFRIYLFVCLFVLLFVYLFTKCSPAKAVLLEHVFRCQSHGAVVAVKYLGL